METSGLWEKYAAGLKIFLHQKVKDEEVTKDLLQEVFLKAHVNKGKLRKEGAMKSWLYSIAYNLMMDYFKSHRVGDPGIIPEITSGDAMEEDEESHDPAHCLEPLIKNLPEIYQRALILSDIEGRKQAEVADLLRISVSGAKSRIQRGRKLLQEGFMQCCNYTLSGKGTLVGEHKSLNECKVCQ